MENEADTEQSSSLTEKSVLSSHSYPKPSVASHPNPTPPVLHSSNPNLHSQSHPHPQGLHFSGFSADTAHPHPFRPYALHPSPLARTSSNSSLCSVLTPEKMKSIISGGSRRGSISDLRQEALRSENPRRGSATGNYGIPVPPDSRRFGGSSILNNSSMPASRNNSISCQINSFSGIHPPVPTGKQNAGVNGLKEHRENRDSTRNENDYSNLPLRKSENELGKLKAFSALYTGQELREKEEENVTGLKKVLRFLTFGLSGDADGPGCCAFFLAIFSALIVIATLPLSLFFTVKVVKEYERAVIFRLGRLRMGGAKGPGIFFIIPCIDSFIKVDLRTVSFDVPPQEILSRDSVTVSVDAVVYYRVSNPTMAMNNVEDFRHSTHLLAATTLRNVLGTKGLAEILSEREQISHYMETTLDEATDPWGVKVERVEIKDVRLPVQLQRAMAAEAEATREARAKVIQAEGEKTASTALRAASEIISINPAAMQLRYLQTLNSISGEKNSTIIFPIPIDFMANFGSKKLQ